MKPTESSMGRQPITQTLQVAYNIPILPFNSVCSVYVVSTFWLKAEVDSLFLVSMGKCSILTFKHNVIQVSEKKLDFSSFSWLCFQAFKKLGQWRES